MMDRDRLRLLAAIVLSVLAGLMVGGAMVAYGVIIALSTTK